MKVLSLKTRHTFMAHVCHFATITLCSVCVCVFPPSGLTSGGHYMWARMGGGAEPGWMRGEVIALAWRCRSTMMLLSPTMTQLRPK